MAAPKVKVDSMTIAKLASELMAAPLSPALPWNAHSLTKALPLW
jgi:hypothetical protein